MRAQKAGRHPQKATYFVYGVFREAVRAQKADRHPQKTNLFCLWFVQGGHPQKANLFCLWCAQGGSEGPEGRGRQAKAAAACQAAEGTAGSHDCTAGSPGS